MKPSYQTGEFWLYVVFGIIAVYLKRYNVDIDDVVNQGAELVKSMGGADSVMVLIVPFIYGAKRMALKAWQAKLDAQVSIAAISSKREG